MTKKRIIHWDCTQVNPNYERQIKWKERRMFCQRCKGLLVRETLGDLRGEKGCTDLATRCINCGYIEDSVMRANRLCPPATKRSVPRMRVMKGGVVFNSYTEGYLSPVNSV